MKNKLFEHYIVNEININLTRNDDEHITDSEIAEYIKHFKAQSDQYLTTLDIDLDGEFVDIHAHYKQVPFNRIRRITGYLVGTLDKFNDAKKSEESDRVKHSL